MAWQEEASMAAVASGLEGSPEEASAEKATAEAASFGEAVVRMAFAEAV